MDKSGVNQYFSYSGDLAITHTRKMIKMIKDRGVKVLSYFISEDGNYYADITFAKFRKMYGEDAVQVNISNATEVVRTMNKLLLNRGA
jgi:nitric oxide reductase activation protein